MRNKNITNLKWYRIKKKYSFIEKIYSIFHHDKNNKNTDRYNYKYPEAK